MEKYHLIKQILHKLEVSEPLSPEALKYLYNQARKNPIIYKWLEKTLDSQSLNAIDSEYTHASEQMVDDYVA